jgi:hypothetical protein
VSLTEGLSSLVNLRGGSVTPPMFQIRVPAKRPIIRLNTRSRQQSTLAELLNEMPEKVTGRRLLRRRFRAARLFWGQ